VVYASASAAMFWQERAMRRPGGPGIVGLELAGSAERVEAILEAWGPEGQAAARRSLSIDYLVLAAYGPLLAELCRRAGGRLGPATARAQYVAAACDIGENTALLAVLGGRRGRLPVLARGMALAKFTLLGAGVAHIVWRAVRDR
jgi:hypothetical protein